ncbi:unnamed protein product [Callosobruchus maculatus]|uniref:Uncharacterized protein n=1 Tax=Callosobruchus maculatus TaxID=64391 RepID=A0A653C457_CALMS|nr:unnamed protein product [Callosobruchus maculatus]
MIFLFVCIFKIYTDYCFIDAYCKIYLICNNVKLNKCILKRSPSDFLRSRFFKQFYHIIFMPQPGKESF